MSKGLKYLCLSVFVSGCLFGAAGAADYPEWWVSRAVVNTNATTTNDYAAVNAGQLKWFATNAYDELNASLPGGAGTNLAALIAGFTASNNDCGINLGQLKYAVKPFYDRLIEEGYTNVYPWTGAPSTNDYAMANCGQVKHLFNFDAAYDSDSDGMPDWWEMLCFGSLDQTAGGDYDSDGITNLQEYQRETNPADSGSANLSIYVDGATGSDAYDGLAAAWDGKHGPKETIGGGIAAGLDGDTISIQAGTYSELPTTYSLIGKDLTISVQGTTTID